MHSVSRSLFTAAVIALSGVAACGDKVVLTQPGGDTTPTGPGTPQVTEVRVTPQQAQMSINQTQTFSAAVLGTNLTNFGVTWRSTNTTVATVDANGVVTAKANGTTNIEATSAQNTNVKGFATVIVNPDIQAGVAVASITGANGAAVNVDSVAGQINVGLNITQGTGAQRLDSVKVFLLCGTTTTEVYRQTFTGGTTPPGSIVAPVNTSAFNATTGAATFPNASGCTFRSVGYTAGGQTVATTSTAINLRNLDVARVTVTSQRQASDTGAKLWNGGDITVRVLPVVYSGTQIASSSVTLTGTDVGAGTHAAPTGTAYTKTAATTNGVATFSGTTTATASNTGLRNITLPNAQVSVSMIGANGQAVVFPGNPLAGQPGTVIIYPNESSANTFFRVDNESPSVPATSVANLNATQDWIGGNFTFTATGATPTVTGFTGGAVRDEGVNSETYSFFAQPTASAVGVGTNGVAGSSTTTATCTALPGTQVTNSSTLARTNSVAEGYDFRVAVTDRLQNTSCVDLDSGNPFGVDPVVPTARFDENTTTGLGENGIVTAGGGTFDVLARDTLSGFRSNTEVLRVTIVRNNDAATAANCITGFFTNGACTPIFQPEDVTLTPTTVGYYTYTSFAQDVAGNTSTPILTRTVIFDNVAPVLGALTQSAAIAPLGTVTMSATATDNFDLKDAVGNLQYATPNPATFAAGGNTLGSFGLPSETSGTATFTAANVFRSLSEYDQTAGTINGGAVTPVVNGQARDQANNLSNVSSAAVTFTATSAAAATPNINRFQLVNENTATPLSGNFSRTTNRVFQARVVTGPSVTDAPFSNVILYRVVGGQLQQVSSVGTPSVTIDPVTNERIYVYSFPAGVAPTTGALTYRAIGVTLNGNAAITGPAVVTGT